MIDDATVSSADIQRAFEGDDAALSRLMSELIPVVQGRVGRVLWRRRAQSKGADMKTTIEDLVQEVFVELLRDGGKVLRSWTPERGLTLKSFVRLVSEQRVSAILRSRRRSPWNEELAIDDDVQGSVASESVGPESSMLTREELARVLDEVRARVSPLGLELFYALVVREEPVAEVCTRMGMSVAAVHAWSSRLRRLVQELSRGAAPVSEPHRGGTHEVRPQH